jgi:hypothetical protein
MSNKLYRPTRAYIFLVLNIFLFIIIFWLTAFSNSASSSNTSVQYIVSVVALLVLILNIVSFYKNKLSLFRPLIIFPMLLILLFFAMGGLNCARCISPDMRALTPVRQALSVYYDNHKLFPDSLEQLNQNNSQYKFDQKLFKYKRINDTYNLCSIRNIRYFYGIQINSGEWVCRDKY